MTSPGPAPYTREGGVTDDGLTCDRVITEGKKNNLFCFNIDQLERYSQHFQEGNEYYPSQTFIFYVIMIANIRGQHRFCLKIVCNFFKTVLIQTRLYRMCIQRYIVFLRPFTAQHP